MPGHFTHLAGLPHKRIKRGGGFCEGGGFSREKDAMEELEVLFLAASA